MASIKTILYKQFNEVYQVKNCKVKYLLNDLSYPPLRINKTLCFHVGGTRAGGYVDSWLRDCIGSSPIRNLLSSTLVVAPFLENA